MRTYISKEDVIFVTHFITIETINKRAAIVPLLLFYWEAEQGQGASFFLRAIQTL